VAEDKRSGSGSFVVSREGFIHRRTWFWMDVLCVDQRNVDERIGIIQHIPTIFNSAQRTLAVRESWGIHCCCPEAAEVIYNSIFVRGEEGLSKIFAHWSEKPSHKPRIDEGFLTRLWPWQELMLSDSIQFIRCTPSKYSDPPPSTSETPFLHCIEAIGDLHLLARHWHRSGDAKDVKEFVHCFIADGTISRPSEKITERSIKLGFREHVFSLRRTSDPRDFIFAVMSPSGWYSIPTTAKMLTFGQLFVDCCRKAFRRGFLSITPLFTSGPGPLNEAILTPHAAENIPTPVYMGDTMRLLLGTQVWHPKWNQAEVMWNSEPPTISSVDVTQVIGCIGVSETLSLILQCMVFDMNIWQASVWSPTFDLSRVNEWHEKPSGDGWSGREDRFDVISLLRYLYDWITVDDESQALRKLTLLMLIRNSSRSFLDSLLLLTAMISCGVPVSAFVWAEQHLTPLQLEYGGIQLLALAPNSIADQHLRGECNFCIVEVEEAILLLAGEKERPDMYTRCLFPRSLD